MTHNTQKLLILGTRTFAVEVADLIGDIEGVEVAGFVENMQRQRCKDTLEDLPIFWIDELNKLVSGHSFVCGLSTTKRSLFTDQAASLGARFTTLVHPTSRISKSSSLEKGCIVSTGAIVGSHSHLGYHVILNRGCLIGHHTEIGNYVSIQPGANIAGACQINDAAYIGMGAVVIDHVTVGKNSVVAAGAVVTKDVPDNVLVAGIPAKVKKENIEGK